MSYTLNMSQATEVLVGSKHCRNNKEGLSCNMVCCVRNDHVHKNVEAGLLLLY